MARTKTKRKERKRSYFLPIALLIVVVFLILLSLILNSASKVESSKYTKIAVIKLNGPIQSSAAPGLFASPVATSKDLVDFIEKAEKNKDIKGVIIEINSPGGTVLASKDIGNAVKSLTKPNVALIRDLGASGGYWVASASDHIIADELSITGSIGVISSSLSFEGLLNDYNVSYQRLVGGKYKDAGIPFRDMTREELAIFQKKIDAIHTAFIEEVATNREMDPEKVREAATGIFYLGQEAYDLGLVDELGGKEEAKDYLKKQLDVDAVKLVEYSKPKTFFEQLAEASSSSFFYVGEGIASGLTKQELSSDFEILLR